MRALLLTCLLAGCGWAQYPTVLLNSGGHPSQVYNAAPTFPDLSGFTWVQQEGATLTQNTLAPPVLYFPNTGNKHEKMLLTAAPSPPYTVTFGVTITQTDSSKQVSATLMLRNSVADTALVYTDENEQSVTGPALCCKVIAGGHLTQTLNVDADSVLSTSFVMLGRFPAQRNWLRIVDDGVHRTLYSSNDDKRTWTQDFQELTSALAPNQVGISGYTLESASFVAFYLTVWEFTITQP